MVRFECENPKTAGGRVYHARVKWARRVGLLGAGPRRVPERGQLPPLVRERGAREREHAAVGGVVVHRVEGAHVLHEDVPDPRLEVPDAGHLRRRGR